MIVIPASLRSDFIHMAGMTIHIALESTIHIVGIRNHRINGVPLHHLLQELTTIFLSSDKQRGLRVVRVINQPRNGVNKVCVSLLTKHLVIARGSPLLVPLLFLL